MASIRDNLSLKLFALMLAILLEVYFYSPDNSVTEHLVASVQLRNLPANKMVVSPVGGVRNIAISLTVRGPAPVVQQLKREPLTYNITLPPGTGESYMEYVKPEQLTLGASGVHVIDFSPAIIDLRFETVVRKELLVIVQQRGEPAEGFRLKRLNVRPVSVIARGPESELSGVGVVETQLLDLEGLTGPMQTEVSLVPPGVHTLLDVNVVSVDVKVVPVISERSISGVRIGVRSSDGGATTVSPSSATVVVSGPVNELESLTASDIELLVDVSNLSDGRQRVPISAQVPEGINLESVTPATAEVVVVRKREALGNGSATGAQSNG